MQAFPQTPQLMVTPTDSTRRFGEEEVEKDSHCPVRLISRCSTSSYPEIVEKDMKRSTPTTPGTSSFPASPPAAASDACPGSDLPKGQFMLGPQKGGVPITSISSSQSGTTRISDMLPRGPQSVHLTSDGCRSSSSSSASSSVASPTEGQEAVGMASVSRTDPLFGKDAPALRFADVGGSQCYHQQQSERGCGPGGGGVTVDKPLGPEGYGGHGDGGGDTAGQPLGPEGYGGGGGGGGGGTAGQPLAGLGPESYCGGSGGTVAQPLGLEGGGGGVIMAQPQQGPTPYQHQEIRYPPVRQPYYHPQPQCSNRELLPLFSSSHGEGGVATNYQMKSLSDMSTYSSFSLEDLSPSSHPCSLPPTYLPASRAYQPTAAQQQQHHSNTTLSSTASTFSSSTSLSAYSPSSFQPTYPPSHYSHQPEHQYAQQQQQAHRTITEQSGWGRYHTPPLQQQQRPLSSNSYTTYGTSSVSPNEEVRYHSLGSPGSSHEHLLGHSSHSSTLSSLNTPQQEGGPEYGYHYAGGTRLPPSDRMSNADTTLQESREREWYHKQNFYGSDVGREDPRYFQQQHPPYHQQHHDQLGYDHHHHHHHHYHQYQHQELEAANHRAERPRPSSWYGSAGTYSRTSDESLAGGLQRSLVISEDTTAGQSMGSLPDNTKLPPQFSESIEILIQPTDLTVELHQKAVFTCKVLLDGQPGEAAGACMQWYKGGQALKGEVGVDLVVSEAGEEDADVYHCVISHPKDSAVKKHSKSARLSIKKGSPVGSESSRTARGEGEGEGEEEEEVPLAPVIVDQPPEFIRAVVGEDLVLQLKVKGKEPLSFKWFKDTRELDFVYSEALVISAAAYTDSGQYCCSVNNLHGSQLSRSFNVTVSRIKVKEASPAGKAPRQRPKSLHNWEGSNISDAFLLEIGRAIARQTSNWQKLATYLGLSHSDLCELQKKSNSLEDHAIGLLFRWREISQEGKDLLKVRLTRAGIDFEMLISNIPGGQVQGMEMNVIAIKPHIILHPQSQHVMYGQAFSLSVKVASPSLTCNFQWYKNHYCLNGKIEPDLIVKSAIDSDAGEYYCVASNKGGSTDSDIAFIRVFNPHPQCAMAQPQASRWSGDRQLSQHMSLDERSFAMKVGPSGSWRGGGGGGYFSAGTTTEGFLKRGYTDSDIQLLREQGERGFSNPGSFITRRGSGASLEAPPSIGEKPTILEHPESQTVEVGGPMTLSCKATGQGELSYLWYFNGLSLAKEDRNEYFLNCFTDEDEGVYFCKVSNRWGEVNSNMAHIQMKDDESD